MRARPWLPLILLVSCAAPALGLTPRLVKDINPISSGEGSEPEFHFSSGGFALAYFVADDGETGRELWRTDGTEAGTFQILDACPGECPGSPVGLARSGDLFFFSASDAAGRESLWATRGTPAATFRVLEEPARPAFRRSVWIASAGALFFSSSDPDHGLELWRTDGTAAGTFLVTDLRSGPQGSGPDELTELDGRLFFRADDGRGPSLWTSDGTAQGTRLVRDPVPGAASHLGPAFLRAAGKNLFFTAPPPRGGAAQLWKSDGTTRGTVTLTSLKPGASTNTNTIPDVTVLGNRLFFIAETPAGQELWVSDGTPKGTRVLTAFTLARPFVFSLDGRGPAFPRTALANRIFFHASDGVQGVGLWTSDGTPRGTRLIKDLCPDFCGIPSTVGIAVGQKWYFTAYSESSGQEVWVTDGSPGGTRLLRDLCPGPCSSSPEGFHAVGNRVYFGAVPFLNGPVSLWRSDGTAKGTVRLTHGSIVNSRVKATAGGVFLFATNDFEHGEEIWRSDGTPRGTRLLVDLNRRDLGGSFPTGFGAAGGQLYFGAYDGVRSGLWKSDGTEAGTVFVHEFDSIGGEIRGPVDSAPAGGRLVFTVRSFGGPERLWGTDGTSTGTVQLPPEALTPQSRLRTAGNLVFFVGRDFVHGDELWVSDGTPGGTHILDLTPGAASSQISALTAYKGRLYFLAAADRYPATLWTSDGTIAGTFPVVAPGSPETEPGFLTEHADRLWFFDSANSARLWSSDGTAAGTAPAVEFSQDPGLFFPTLLASAGSRLFFSGELGPVDAGLWVTDGTTAGTHRIASQLLSGDRVFGYGGSLYHEGSDSTLWKTDGAGSSQLRDQDGRPIEISITSGFRPPFQVFGGRLYFVDEDGTLYQSDGTEPGTSVILEDVGSQLFSAGGRLFFNHFDPATGTELWVLE